MADYLGKYTGGGIERILDLSDPYMIPIKVLYSDTSNSDRYELLGGEEGLQKLREAAISGGKRFLIEDIENASYAPVEISFLSINKLLIRPTEFRIFIKYVEGYTEDLEVYGNVFAYVLRIHDNAVEFSSYRPIDDILKIDGSGDKALFNDGIYRQIQTSGGIGNTDISKHELHLASEGNSGIIQKLESMPDGIYLTKNGTYGTYGILYIYGTHAYGVSSSSILRIYRLEDTYLDTTILAKIQYTEESDVIYKLYSSDSEGHSIYAKDFSDNEYSLFVYGDTELSIYSANNNSTIQIVYDENVKNNPIIRIGSRISEARDFYIKFAKNESGNIQFTGNPISIHLEYYDDIYLRLNTSFGFAERIYPINI